MFYSLNLLFSWSIGFSQFPFFCRKELSESRSSSAFVGPVCYSSSKLPLKSIDISLRTFSVVLLFSIGKSSSSKIFKHCLLLLSIFEVFGLVFVEDFFRFNLSEIFTFFLSLFWLCLLLLIEAKELAEWSLFKLLWSELLFAFTYPWRSFYYFYIALRCNSVVFEQVGNLGAEDVFGDFGWKHNNTVRRTKLPTNLDGIGEKLDKLVFLGMKVDFENSGVGDGLSCTLID